MNEGVVYDFRSCRILQDRFSIFCDWQFHFLLLISKLPPPLPKKEGAGGWRGGSRSCVTFFRIVQGPLTYFIWWIFTAFQAIHHGTFSGFIKGINEWMKTLFMICDPSGFLWHYSRIFEDFFFDISETFEDSFFFWNLLRIFPRGICAILPLRRIRIDSFKILRFQDSLPCRGILGRDFHQLVTGF